MLLFAKKGSDEQIVQLLEQAIQAKADMRKELSKPISFKKDEPKEFDKIVGFQAQSKLD